MSRTKKGSTRNQHSVQHRHSIHEVLPKTLALRQENSDLFSRVRYVSENDKQSSENDRFTSENDSGLSSATNSNLSLNSQGSQELSNRLSSPPTNNRHPEAVYVTSYTTLCPSSIAHSTKTERLNGLDSQSEISTLIPKPHLPPIDEFNLCQAHESNSEYFCHSCVDDGCHKCMTKKHKGHKYGKSITIQMLLNKEQGIVCQTKKFLDTLQNVRNGLLNFSTIIIDAVAVWQKTIGTSVNSVNQIECDFDHHARKLCTIQTDADREFDVFKNMMGWVKKRYEEGDLEVMHRNANHARKALIDLEYYNCEAEKAINNAISCDTYGRNILSDIIKTSGLEVLTRRPISSLEVLDSSRIATTSGGWHSPIYNSSPDTMAPNVPPILEPVFNYGPLSPVVCDSFKFARMDPITPSLPRTPSSWPTEKDQVEIEHLKAIAALLSPENHQQPKDNYHSKWAPRTPQPISSPSTNPWMPRTPQSHLPQFGTQFASPPARRCQSLVALWEQIDQPEQFGLQPLLPLPQQPRQHQYQPRRVIDPGVFEIGFHTTRNYSQIRTPVLKIEHVKVDAPVPAIPPKRDGEEAKKDPHLLCRPWGVCCDKNNLIYIADRSNNRIVVYRTDGTFVRKFGSQGDRPGQLNRPAGLAIDIEGRVVVADKDNHRIQVFSADGEYMFHFGKYGNQHGDFFYPWDVACSATGHIAVSDTRNHRVQIFTSTGAFVRKYGWESRPSMLRELDQPRGVIFLKNNVLLVTDFNNHRIIKINFGDRVTMSQFNKTNDPRSSLDRPQGLTQDADGNILVCDSRHHRVLVLSPQGEYKGEFGRTGKEDGQFDRAVDIAVAPDGKIAVVDLGNNRVQIF